MQGKQCGTCGAPMGIQDRACQQCGHGSAFGNSGLVVVLVVLLLGIGFASGLIPMSGIRHVAVRAPAETVSTLPQRTSAPAQHTTSTPGPRSTKAHLSSPASPDTAAAYMAPDPHAEEVAQVVSAAKCARPDMTLIRQLLEEPGQSDLDRIATRACAAAASKASDGAQFITPQPGSQADSTSETVGQ